MTDMNHNSWLPGFYIRLTLLAWLAMIGFDFFLHAGVLAPLYAAPGTFLLPPERAFALIPLGYLSFLGLAILLTWLMTKLSLHTWQKGMLFGAQLGLLAWGSLVLGLYSISTASPLLLLGWWFGQTIELALAGAVVGQGLKTRKLGRLFLIVLVLVIIAFAAGIIWQNVI